MTPSEVTALWRQLKRLRHQSPKDRDAVFGALGIDQDTGRRILDLLTSLGTLPVFEPGLLIEGDCSPGWQPSVLAPVFHGFQDLGVADGLPGPVRVFFPSIDGSPQNAAIVAGCGRFPLVAFLHGQCSQPNHYRAWDLVPLQLARSGYVVVVPELSSRAPFTTSNPDVDRVEQVLVWMRSSWAHAAALMPRPLTAVVGHSWGALAGAALAVRLQGQQSISAYASLSGGWLEWPSTPPRPLTQLNVATMFMWGTGPSDLFSQLEGGAASVFEEPRGATHKVVFRDGEHWDYFREGGTTCGLFRGPCGLMRSLAADFVATFLSHYVPPQRWTLLPSTIPHSLLPPPFDLTPQQETFAGGHLQGFRNIASSTACRVTHTWRLPPFGGGSVTLGAG